MSGGVEDAKGLEGEFPWYRYGGMVSAFFFDACIISDVVGLLFGNEIEYGLMNAVEGSKCRRTN